jgi:hypothetical protein
LEGTLFDIRVRHEIIVTPMREYIEKLVKTSFNQNNEEDQAEVVGTGHVTATKENTKGTWTIK